ncbi:MAG: hypothetical protein L0271_27585, partial [Gemmatimonadetes bacterium]|nr:hypothetical protein [Gemmatimonadota bacterium]
MRNRPLHALGALLAAGLLGALGALWTGPHSEVAWVASIVAFVAGLVAGNFAWFVLGLTGYSIRFLTRRWPRVTEVDGEPIVPGSWAFIITCAIPTAAGG